MDLALTDRTVIVTGAGRGIGLATVRTLLEEGARVIGITRSDSTDLRNTSAEVVLADLSTPAGVAVVQAALGESILEVDALVNNVGGGSGGETAGFLDLDDGLWSQMLEVNLMSAVRMTRLVLPSLITRGGAIVNVSSIGAWQPAGPPLAYNVAKSALKALGKGLAEEFGPLGVRVTTVSPGPTRTDVWESDDGLGARLAEASGLALGDLVEMLPSMLGMVTGRLAEPAEIAAMIAFLLSPRAASITGSDHRIDGGAVKAA